MKLACTRLIVAALIAASGAACRERMHAAGPVTFNRDVAPVLWSQCASCHRPGGVAPFSVFDYTSVRAHSRQIADVIRRGVMPPWAPAPGYGTFADERRLTAGEIDLLTRWVESGSPEGEPSDRRAPPSTGDIWQMGTPDLVVSLDRSYTLPGDGPDVFRNFVVRLPSDRVRYVRGIEMTFGDAVRVVHHATVLIDATHASRQFDGRDGQPGFDGDQFSESTRNPSAHAIGWTPGKRPYLEPVDMGWELPADADVIVQLHMIPSGKPETIRPTVGFIFAPGAPARRSVDFKMGTKQIDIAPGEADYAVSDSYTLPVDVDLLSIYPHAHYLAKDMQVTATLPDGAKQWLLWIKNWDFRWQDQYRYETPTYLPRGTRIEMRYTYDNSGANVHNPAHPPARVQFGPRSGDEMGDLWLRFLPRAAAGAQVIAADYERRELRMNIGFNERMVAEHPGDAAWAGLLGTRYLEAGRTDEGIHALQAALRLQPSQPQANNNLGAALLAAGQARAAIPYLEAAARLTPESYQAQANLANALQDIGDLDRAIVHFSRGVALNPALPEAHNNLGVALASRGLVDRAAVEFARAVELNPQYADALDNLSKANALGARGVSSVTRH